MRRARREVDEGLLPAAQLALAFQGEIVAAETFGDASARTRFTMFSCVKPTVSLTVLTLAGEHKISLDEPVASVLPSFGGNGKESITLSQVLLHAGGFPYAPIGRGSRPTAPGGLCSTRIGIPRGPREAGSSITHCRATGCWPT